MKNTIVKVFLLILILTSSMLWVGYSSTQGRLKRGRYIVEGPGHCFECHSEVDWETPGGQPQPGQKGAGTEFGKYGIPWLVAPNITPDVETGAGAWTDEQLAQAIREGGLAPDIALHGPQRELNSIEPSIAEFSNRGKAVNHAPANMGSDQVEKPFPATYKRDRLEMLGIQPPDSLCRKRSWYLAQLTTLHLDLFRAGISQLVNVSTGNWNSKF